MKTTMKHQKNDIFGEDRDLLETQVARKDDAEIQGHRSVTFPLEQGRQVSRPKSKHENRWEGE